MRKAAAICLVLVTLTLCMWFILNRTRAEARQTALDAVSVFRSLVDFTPRVRITSSVTAQKTSPVLELSTVKKEFPLQHHFESVWLGSKKAIDVGGQYAVKAGFDLREDFTLDIDAETNVIHASFPRPKVLSVELAEGSFKILQDSNGIWNRISPEDRQGVVNDMNGEARAKALELGVLEQAKESLKKQIGDLAAQKGQQWDIRFRD